LSQWPRFHNRASSLFGRSLRRMLCLGQKGRRGNQCFKQPFGHLARRGKNGQGEQEGDKVGSPHRDYYENYGPAKSSKSDLAQPPFRSRFPKSDRLLERDKPGQRNEAEQLGRAQTAKDKLGRGGRPARPDCQKKTPTPFVVPFPLFMPACPIALQLL
jgi:hypothetical protein